MAPKKTLTRDVLAGQPRSVIVSGDALRRLFDERDELLKELKVAGRLLSMWGSPEIDYTTEPAQ